MITSGTCQICGAELRPDTDDVFCPACILRSAIAGTADESPPASPPKLPRPFGTYELLEEVARGGMGIVYRARQRPLNRTVALKVLIAGAGSSELLLRRFRIEAEAAGALQHPHIVAIHELGEHDGQPYITMDFVGGRNLAQVCGGQPLEDRRAARYLRIIADAVQFAHARGVLHRDIKPSNVMIDEEDRPRITDFGLAKRLGVESSVTVTGQMVGSPNYVPPEQALGREAEINARTDVYSLGALLYHLLTGRPPFLAGTIPGTLRLVLETEPVAPRRLNPAVPADLETICLKCLEKDQARRYQTAQELVDELDRFLKGEPILARPVPAIDRGWRWCRRHPAIAGLSATVVLALATASVVFFVSARRIDRARMRERVARVAAEESLYAADMMFVGSGDQAVGGNDVAFSIRTLNAARPGPGKRDLRGFEWRYYWSRLHSDAIATLKGHRQVVDAARFSPTGRLIVTHSVDGVLKIWDANTSKELYSRDGVAVVGGIAENDRQLIFSQPDHSIWRLDLSSRQATRLGAATGHMISASPDGRTVVIIGSDQRPVRVSLEGAAASGPGSDVPADTHAVVSADGTRAAVAGRPYRGVLVVELATGRQIAAFADLLPITSLAISPDGARLVSGGFDGMLKVWDVNRGTLERSIKVSLDPIWALAFSPDGQSVAVSGNDRTVSVWATSDWRETATLRGHLGNVRCVAFSPDGRRLVTGSEDDLALIWPSHLDRPPTEMRRLLRGPSYFDHTPGLAFSPDSRVFAGTAADGTIKVWNSDTMECVASFPMDARSVAFSPDGKSVLGAGFDGVVRRWALDGKELGRAMEPARRFTDWQVDPLTPQERVAIVSAQRETRAGCRLCEIPSTRDGILGGAMTTTEAIAVSPDGRTLYIGLPGGRIQVWNLATRRKRFEFAAHKLDVTALAVSADGRYLASGGLDNSTRLWEAATGKPVATFGGHNRPVWALAFSPDGKTLAAGSCDKKIVLCSVTLRRQVGSLLMYTGTPQGYEQEVRLLRFSPDGNILAAALGDGTLRFFRAAPFSETDHQEDGRRAL